MNSSAQHLEKQLKNPTHYMTVVVCFFVKYIITHGML